jgi:hypothetical protein
VSEACRIERWRGYVASSFYAVADDGEPLLESPAFRWRAASLPPDLAPAQQAHAELLSALNAAGWRADGANGPEWYATRFVRGLAPERMIIAQEPAATTPSAQLPGRSLSLVEPPSTIALAEQIAVLRRSVAPVRTGDLLSRSFVLLAAAFAVLCVRRLR